MAAYFIGRCVIILATIALSLFLATKVPERWGVLGVGIVFFGALIACGLFAGTFLL